ncbi:hypothetical protein FXN63_09425 [Pigmentiphaga aceris]|uniref:Uncharacterized protein n=1 Tax=Pigmentiphaga aceris TaxID=1940612 RepID=A0A5C0AUF6_9BURK|nr:hypothetical protein [Pigmentiphaga aceris]QEI06032.1 hypothetical protein FXN63_09425 [Pigmentiphaga aceris]
MSPLLRVLLVVGGVAAGVLAVGARAASEPAPGDRPRVVFDAAGKPKFIGMAGWVELSRTEQDGRQVVEYRFPQPGTNGQEGILRVMLQTVARSTRFADLSPDERIAVEASRDAAVQHMMDEIDAMPGVDFLSGGTQFTFTALDDAKRYYYVHHFAMKGIDQPGNKLRPAVTIDFRCRNAIEVATPGYDTSIEPFEEFCRDALLDINKPD